MNDDRRLARYMLDELESIEGKLNSWERSFVASLQDDVDGRGLTENQMDKLRQIYEEKTA